MINYVKRQLLSMVNPGGTINVRIESVGRVAARDSANSYFPNPRGVQILLHDGTWRTNSPRARLVGK